MRHAAKIALAVLWLSPMGASAQPVPASASAPATALPPIVPQTGSERDFPALTLTEGKPIEQRTPEKRDNRALFPEQTRAPYRATDPFKVTVITDKLHKPWSLAFLPGGKYLVTEKEQPGAMRIVAADGAVSAPLAGLEGLAPPATFGLLGVTLDPNFARNRRVFFAFFERLPGGYSNTNIAHAVLDEAGLKLTEVTVIFRGLPAFPIKNFSSKQGGRIVFAKDGSLYSILGDRDAGKPWLVAQQLDNHLGKAIHITQDGKPARDNPFLKTPGALPEIYALGLRSPQGLAMDAKGSLWETEHGPRGGDELNNIAKGRNYGWPIIAHGIDYPGVPIGDGSTAKPGLEQPVYYWDPVIAPSSVTFYKGDLFPQWKNSVLVGALRGTMLDRLEMRGGKVVAEEPLLFNLKARIRDVRVAPDGAVYVLTESDRLLRLTPQ
jgi:glucose/arabinose dehydrogenase